MLKLLQSAARRRWLAAPLIEAAFRKQHVHSRRLCSSSWGAASAAPENSSPFVSKYHQVDPSDITTYLTRKGLEFKLVPGEVVVKVCPLCSKPHNSKLDNQWKLYFSTSTGAFFCFRCGAKGSFFDFKQRLGDLGADYSNSSAVMTSPAAPASPSAKPLKLEDVVEPCKDLLERSAFPDALKYVTETRGLSVDVLREYMVGARSYPFREDGSTSWKHHECLVFPWLSLGDSGDAAQPLKVRRLKARSISQNSAQMSLPPGGEKGMFGMHTVPPDARSVVITEGELDAMSVRQATGAFAVSLPNGARSLPVELLPWLERFEKIYLWLDDDEAGREGTAKLISKLGRSRCMIVRPQPDVHREGKPPKDANEALTRGLDLSALLNSAGPQPHDQILSFNDLRNDVYRELVDPITVAGTPFRWLPSLQGMLKGHRNGELTILTGPTGSGKTTLLSQLSLDLCDQGIPTLWGSFEIKNVRLLKRMMTQFCGRDLSGISEDEFDMVSNQFGGLPMYFLKFFGSTDVHKVLDAMDYAVYVNDVEHIVLDNLQFMLGAAGGRGFDKFDQQERALDLFRQFATAKNVHITLVVHPRKEAESASLGINSVFGTAKATQEADNVIILQHTPEGKHLDIRKNRFDGTLGQVPIRYDTASLTFKETTLMNTFRPTGSSVTSHRSESVGQSDDAFPVQHLHKDFLHSQAVQATTAGCTGDADAESARSRGNDAPSTTASGSFAATSAKKRLGRPRKVAAPATGEAPSVAKQADVHAIDMGAPTVHPSAVVNLALELDDSLARLDAARDATVQAARPRAKRKAAIVDEIVMA